jgi:hypothetical protein
MKRGVGNQACSENPGEGVQVNSTWPDAPYEGRGSVLLHLFKSPKKTQVRRFLGSRTRRFARQFRVVNVILPHVVPQCN